eukprot:UN3790
MGARFCRILDDVHARARGCRCQGACDWPHHLRGVHHLHSCKRVGWLHAAAEGQEAPLCRVLQ